MMDGAASSAVDPAAHRPHPQAWWRPGPQPGDLGGSHGLAGAEPAEGFLDRPIFESFAAIARRQPAAPAVCAGGHAISYGDLLARAASLAAQVRAAIAPDAAVATLLPDPVDAACGMLACLAAGRPWISLNPDYPAGRLGDILAEAGAGGLILPPDGVPAGLAGALPPALALIPLHAPGGTPVAEAGTPLEAAGTTGAPRPGLQDAPCVVIYTSGSTGRPKGIVRSQRQMLVRVGHRIRGFRLTPADRMLLLYPLSSGPGVTATLAALLSGGALHVVAASAIGGRRVLDVAREAGVTTVCSVPALLRTLLALDGAGAAFASLRSIYTSSESLLRQDLDDWRRILPPGCAIRTGYGLTEGAPLADWFLPVEVPRSVARLPIGYPLPWHDFAITDPDGASVPDGQPGELWVRSRMLSLGEWRHGRCVPGSLLPDPDDPEGAILWTGDLVCRQRDGLLAFLGRIDEQIRMRGNRVEPSEIELVLRQTRGVADAAILARRTAIDPVLVAFVVPTDVAEPALRNMVDERLRAALPSFMVPARVHVIAAVPKLPGGKVDPAALERIDDTLNGPGVIKQGAIKHGASIRTGAPVVGGRFARLRRLVGLGTE
jgi:acyl-coenzyme A synthetase/AMP-(fatty) acid ligase